MTASVATHDLPSRPVPLTAFERRFKHPPGLVILFFAEMWERFSYYGMRGLLKLYMANYLFVTAREALQGCRQLSTPCQLVSGNPENVLFWPLIRGLLPNNPQEAASLLYGTYTALVYLTPFFGGILADRWLGQRKTVVVGGVLMALGHFVMAIESSFFLALLLLILGNGAFKPNVSTQVGGLYAAGDPRRDGAYTIFYMGINLGAFICNFICGTLAVIYGWHFGFAAAGVGMLLGLGVYIAGQKYLAPDQLAQRREAGKTQAAPLDQGEKQRVLALIALCALNVVFWAVYEQQGNTLQLWADRSTAWPTIAGFTVPSTWYQSFNPFMIFFFVPLLAAFWAWQARRGNEPSSVMKLAIGCALEGLGFVVMIAAELGAEPGQRLSPWWLVAATAIFTIGELYLSPIGLSLVTKVAPARLVSTMMGVWFFANFIGNTLAGWLGSFYEVMPRVSFFSLMLVIGVAGGVVLWVTNRRLNRIMVSHSPAPTALSSP